MCKNVLYTITKCVIIYNTCVIYIYCYNTDSLKLFVLNDTYGFDIDENVLNAKTTHIPPRTSAK